MRTINTEYESDLKSNPESEQEITERYLTAVNEFIEIAKKDVNVIAVVVIGSLTNDIVWEKSDIDMTVVVRDQKLTVTGFCLDMDGIVLSVNVQERSSFVRMLEKGGYVDSFMAKAQVMYTTDDSITQMVEQSKHIGAKDAQLYAFTCACDAICLFEKCEKWLYIKKDYTYCRFYIIQMAAALARMEICMAKESPGREVFQHAQRLNPELIQRFYYYPMSRELNAGELEELLREMDAYIMKHIDFITEPILDYLEDGEIKTVTMIGRHFRQGGGFLVHILEYFASKGIIEKLSETIRITPKSRPNFEEIAFMSTKNLPGM